MNRLLQYSRYVCLVWAMLLLGFSQNYAQSNSSGFTGSVVDAATGMPISGAAITAIGHSPNGDSLFYRTVSGNAGTYAINNIPSASYHFLVEAANYEVLRQGPIFVAEGQVLALDFALSSRGGGGGGGSGSLAGTVRDARNQDPIANVRIHLLGGGILYRGLTDVNGYYQIDSIASGIYFLEASAPGYLPFFSNAPIRVDSTGQPTIFDFNMAQDHTSGNASLAGLVSDDSTGLPIRFARLTLSGFDSSGVQRHYETTSNPNGGYLFDNVLSGFYTLTAEAANYLPFRTNLTLNDGANTLDIAMTRSSGGGGATLRGVVSEMNSNVPVFPVVLNLFGQDSTGHPQHYTTHNNPDGSYRFDNIQPGIYSLMADAPDFEPYFNRVIINSGQNTLDIVLTRIGGGGPVFFTGIVVDSITRVSVPNARVEVLLRMGSGDSLVAHTVTSNTGQFELSGFPAGVYDLRITQQNYHVQRLNNQHIPPGYSHLVIFLEPLNPPPMGTISGRVTFDGSGDPAHYAMVELIGVNRHYSQSTTVDSAGNYHFRAPEGNYYVSVIYFAFATGFPYQEYYDDVLHLSDATVLTVSQNNPLTGIDFGIPDDGGFHSIIVQGNVSDNTGRPLVQASVNLVVHAGPIFGDSLYFGAHTDANGDYTIDLRNLPIPIRSFIVFARAANHHVEFWEEQPTVTLADEIFVNSDTTITGINFTLEPRGGGSNSISGTVSSDDGTLIQDAFVVGANLVTSEISFSFSDATGHYELSGLDAAPHVVLFAAAGHIPEYYDNALIWENATRIFVNGNITGVDAVLSSGLQNPGNGVVTGTVFDSRGNRLNGVLLTVEDAAGNVISHDFSDGQGGYQLTGLHDGDHTVYATKINYNSENQAVTLIPGPVNTTIVDFDLADATVSIDSPDDGQIPATLALFQNFPNPFNPETQISFELPESGDVKLTVYNIVGQRIVDLLDKPLSAGRYTVRWNGKDFQGRTVASGIYFYQLVAGNNKSIVKKMLFSK